jgi:hypothetical protein
MKCIFIDNNIWDQLCDQRVEPKAFMDVLAAKGYTLVISFHSVYEFGRLFATDDATLQARGRRLCAYVKRFLDLGMPCMKEFWELIVAEAYAFEKGLSSIDPMATPEQSAQTNIAVTELATGIINDRVRPFLEQRLQFAKDTRDQQKEHLAARNQLTGNLKVIAEMDLADWMRKETITPEGANTLYKKFIKRLGPGPTPENVLNLLKLPMAEAARASVRADLYYNWHCAQYGGLRLDLTDDLLHLVQAVYCNLYLSEDKSQARYGPRILTPRTHIEIYPDRKIPIEQWIVSVL